MRILIIDNNSLHLDKLIAQIRLFSQTTPTVKKFDAITLADYTNYDGIILSGGSDILSVNKGSNAVYASEIALVKKYKKPILGICLGFQIIAHTFGEALEKREKRCGEVIITIKRRDVLCEAIPKQFSAYEAHKWFLPKTTFLTTLATSSDGVEILRHPTRNIYGVQFHPEVEIEEKNAKLILKNFIEQIVNK
ncbi:MAG: gamma-glutamyl-gamma-aminobutyrate hydrolase family protein [Candidatus Woesearchaeota archaeon]